MTPLSRMLSWVQMLPMRFSESQISRVVNRHDPIKQAYQRKKKLSCMNGSLKHVFFFKKSEIMKITETPKHVRSIGYRASMSIN